MLLLFILISLLAKAQVIPRNEQGVEMQYEQFKKEFDKEFGEDIVNENQKNVLSYQPSVKLKSWFTGSNGSDNQQIIFGISDPGLDSLDALKQATVRALALAAFSEKSNIQNVSDNYYLEHEGNRTLGKFNSFTTYTASGNPGFNILEQQYTSNGEMIVKLATTRDAREAVKIDASLELFQSETSGLLITRIFLEVDAQMQDGETLHATWLLQETPRSIEIESAWNGQRLNLMNAKFKYFPEAKSNPESKEISGFWFDMKYGLWYAYISAMAVNMEQMEVFSSQVKFLDEKYKERFQDLTRVVFSEKVSFRMSGIELMDNEMSLRIEKY
jgi:hypothetical protein